MFFFGRRRFARSASAAEQHPEVDTSYGRLRGKKEKSIEGLDYYAFRGIPYAKPPVGELRFKDPVPPEPWSNTREAFEFGPMCVQNDIITTATDGSEDCLYLNVYANKIEPNARYPVMVWIHAGGFSFGSGADLFYGPDYFMQKDVILVTINYRLGAFGFLDLQDDVAPGNQGLKDQVMALKWIRDNIARFGGDSENITTFGQSAGGAAVHYLAMSPLSKGLIHKAISQSGTALSPWASSPCDPKLNAYKLCQLLNIETRDHKQMIQRLRDVDAMALIKATQMLSVIEKNLAVFVPGTDKMSPQPFLPLPLHEAAQQGVNVPYLLGHTNREGVFFYKLLEKMSAYISKDTKLHKDFHPNVSRILSEYNRTICDLETMYGVDDYTSDKNVERIIDMHGDMHFVHGVHKAIRIQVERNLAPTYMYQFKYDEGHSFTKAMFDFKLPGASHMDDLFYLFPMAFLAQLKLKPLAKGTVSHTVMRRMIEMWTNFAKLGHPAPVVSKTIPEIWQPVKSTSIFNCMNIGTNLKMKTIQNIEERLMKRN